MLVLAVGRAGGCCWASAPAWNGFDIRSVALVSTFSQLRRLLPVLAAIGMAGCAGLGVDSASPEGQVRKLAQARWDATLADEYEKVYNLTPPSYRALVSFKGYRSGIGNAAVVVGAKVISVRCTEDACTSMTELAYRHRQNLKSSEPSTMGLEERWIKEDGQWWLYQRP
jgi:hypothetical protein